MLAESAECSAHTASHVQVWDLAVVTKYHGLVVYPVVNKVINTGCSNRLDFLQVVPRRQLAASYDHRAENLVRRSLHH